MAVTRFPTQLLINGQRVTGEGRSEPILNPSTGEQLCEVREASAEQLRDVVDNYNAVESGMQTLAKLSAIVEG